MKKYYQAALTLTAVLSLTALLFYRHEYNKLRFVLQVFNYFGTPMQKGDCNCSTAGEEWNNKYSKFTLPDSSWQRISQDLYVYSAYNNNNGEIRVIGLGKNVNNSKYSCHIFFDDDVESLRGEFSYETLGNFNDESAENAQIKYNSYLLSCKFSHVNKFIIGIQFKDIATENKFAVTPITQVRTLNSNYNDNSSYDNVICVAPPTAGLMIHSDMISFLAFHYYLGWRNFIIYDFGISHVLNNNLKRIAGIADAQWNFTYTTIPWNFPFSQISQSSIRKIIETDCHYRTYNNAMMSVTLSWNEYINLRYHDTVESVLTDIANVNDKMIIDKFQLSTLVYCLEQNNDNLLMSTPAILKSTHRLRKIFNDEPHYIFKLANNTNTNINRQNVDDLIYINRYQKCDIDDKREIIESEMLKFAEHMPSTKIFKSYMTGQLLGI